MIATCISIGTTSLSARPTSSAGRPSGETSWRSCEPDCISSIRFEPVKDAPISAVIATMPGTNHCSADPPVAISGSSGAKRPRKTSGWIIAKTTAIGSRQTGLSSRFITLTVSDDEGAHAATSLSISVDAVSVAVSGGSAGSRAGCDR